MFSFSNKPFLRLPLFVLLALSLAAFTASAAPQTRAAQTADVSDIVTHPREVRQKVGLMPEQDCHIPGMSAVQFVAYAGELSGMPAEHALRRAHECLHTAE